MGDHYVNGMCAFAIYNSDIVLIRHTLNHYCNLNDSVDSQTVEPLQHLNINDKLYKFIPVHKPEKLLTVMELLFKYLMSDREKMVVLRDWCELVFMNKTDERLIVYIKIAKWFIYKGLFVNEYPPLVALLREKCKDSMELKLLFKLY